jgi:hypothetical protein
MRSSPSELNYLVVRLLGLPLAYGQPLQPSVALPAMSVAGTAAGGALRSDTTAAAPTTVGVETVASPLPMEATLAELPRGLTPLGMMLSLAVAPALTWTIWLSRMMRATGTRATVGATGSLVGLRRVWGIMNSFIGISKLHTTKLADVAPGIAQAPLATILRRAAAIPAVVIYHNFARTIASYRALDADASVEIVNHTGHDFSYPQIVDDGRVCAAVQAGAR